MMTRKEERELLECVRANNKMLKQILAYIYGIQANADSENNYDFLRNIVANMVSERLKIK